MCPAESPSSQCPFPGDTEEEVFDCIVNADAPRPHFLSVQGLELIQKVSPKVQSFARQLLWLVCSLTPPWSLSRGTCGAAGPWSGMP